jgi:hypothetical protein
MTITRKLGTTAAGVALSVGGAIAVAAPAHAVVNPANCTWSFNYSSPARVAASCYNSTNSGWHAYIVCENPRGVQTTQPGVEVYGSGTSIAQCPGIFATIAGYGISNT